MQFSDIVAFKRDGLEGEDLVAGSYGQHLFFQRANVLKRGGKLELAQRWFASEDFVKNSKTKSGVAAHHFAGKHLLSMWTVIKVLPPRIAKVKIGSTQRWETASGSRYAVTAKMG